MSLVFSQICEELGWHGKGGMFDVLPLVLQVNGTHFELFDIPTELILEVPLSHPRLVIRIIIHNNNYSFTGSLIFSFSLFIQCLLSHGFDHTFMSKLS